MRLQPTITRNVAKKLPIQGRYIKVESVAFWFWFFIGLDPCITFLFFRSNSALGTLVGCLPPTGFAFFLLSSLLTGNRLKRAEILKPIVAKLLLAFVIWAGVTLFWTGASSPFSAFGYWASIAIKLFVVLLLLFLGNIEQVAIKSLQGFAWGGLVFALVPLLLNAKTIDGRLGDELFLYPNTIGNQMAIITLCCVYLALQSWGRMAEQRLYILISLVLLFTLLRSLSKTSIVCLLLALLIYLVRSKISLQKNKFSLTSRWSDSYLFCSPN